jgi:FkbM family methyltransferase
MLARIIKANGWDLSFTVLEIGARPSESQREPFYGLIEQFPASSVAAFEVDPRVCAHLNKEAPRGVTYYPVALGKTEETREFYETQHPMCSSLYPPDERYADLFHNFEVARLKKISRIDTVSLDHFVQAHDIGPVDFIKIDIQGAELEVFQGGVEALKHVLCIICEVEFVPLYKNQPLFGDVDAFLRSQGMQFHKFLGFGGRAVKPVVVNNDINFAVQYMWADAGYIRDLFNAHTLDDKGLLKMALLLDLYQSPDIAFFLLRQFDTRHHTDLADGYFKGLAAKVENKT